MGTVAKTLKTRQRKTIMNLKGTEVKRSEDGGRRRPASKACEKGRHVPQLLQFNETLYRTSPTIALFSPYAIRPNATTTTPPHFMMTSAPLGSVRRPGAAHGDPRTPSRIKRSCSDSGANNRTAQREQHACLSPRMASREERGQRSPHPSSHADGSRGHLFALFFCGD